MSSSSSSGAHAVAALCERDPTLARVVARWGPPPRWRRPEGFATLLHIILEQQVSLASARTAFERLEALATPLTPTAFLALDDAALRRVGFSRQKTRYGRALAEAVAGGDLDLAALARHDDDEVRRRLTALPGIGPWTAEVYLLMALGRPDAFPAGDLALQLSAQRLYRLPAKPSADALDRLAAGWHPHRGTAARLLWHAYLSQGQPPG